MKKVNLITSLSPKKQYEISCWFWVTFFMFICILTAAAYYIVPQFFIYRSLQKEIAILHNQTKEYADMLNAKDGLKKEYDDWHVRENKIIARKYQKKNPYQHIVEIIAACGDGVQLEAMQFDKKNIEITMMCPSVEHAHVFVKRLVTSHNFSQIKLVSLQKDEQINMVRVAVKGKIIIL